MTTFARHRRHRDQRLPPPIDRWQREDRAPVNAYEWYRRDAHRSATVFIGETVIPASKARGTWFVDVTDLGRPTFEPIVK